MKKIAIVANSTWNIYNFRMSLIQSLNQRHYQVIIIAPPDKYTNQLPESYLKNFIPLPELSPQGKNPFKELLLIRELLHIYKKENPDLILHYTIKPNIYGSLAARRAKIPCISTLTGLGFTFINQGFSTKWIKSLYKLALKNNSYVVFHNKDDQDLFIAKQLCTPKQSKVIQGSGINSDIFSPKENKNNTKDFVFLFIGRLLYDKGIREFIEAARMVRLKYPSVVFWVVGSTKAKNPAAISQKELSDWIKNKDIEYLGTTNNIKSIIQKANVMVLPSYREGLPRATLESMAMEKPIITTDTPGCRATVEDGLNGFLIPIKDSNSLAEACEKMLLMDKIKFHQMGKESRKKVLLEFDEKIINEQYLNLISKILN